MLLQHQESCHLVPTIAWRLLVMHGLLLIMHGLLLVKCVTYLLPAEQALTC